MAYVIQYGCGLSAPTGFRNFDASPTLRLQKLPLIGQALRGRVGPVFPDAVEYGDIIAGLPVPDESCDAVYCSHVLEHLSLADLRVALANTRRVLREGGIFRFVLPDLRNIALSYVNSEDPRASYEFMEWAHLGRATRPRSIASAIRDWLGNSTHLWMWDEASMRIELEQAGFRDIRRAALGDSADPVFANVEEESRWSGCLGMECRR